jgi:hypothetical protein
MTETATMETATVTASATMTAASAMTPAAMGKGSRAGCAEQDSRCADNTEAAKDEHSYRR